MSIYLLSRIPNFYFISNRLQSVVVSCSLSLVIFNSNEMSIKAHKDVVTCVVLADDATTLLTGSLDTTVVRCILALRHYYLFDEDRIVLSLLC